MKNNKIELPAKMSRELYSFKKASFTGFETTTSTQGDGTTTCTTSMTTTHFNKM